MKTRNGTAISPRALRAAKRLGIDPGAVRGSGPSGRVLEADILQSNQHATGTPAVSSMRKAIAKLTSESFATVPHFYLRAELDASNLVALRGRLVGQVRQETGVKLTITDFILRAMAMALHACPQANAIWQNDTLVTLTERNIGLVVGLAEGLLIPVFPESDLRTLTGLASKRTQLVDAARAGKMPADAMTRRAACSLSNLGASRVDEFAAIIPPPQSSILAVGRIAERPFVVDGQLAVRSTMKLCLSIDHRVMDGTVGAEFLGKIVDLLEKPDSLL